MEDRKFLEDFLEEVFKLMKTTGFTVDSISYPRDKRSVDLIGSRDNARIVLKVTLSTKYLSKFEYIDLKKLSKAYGAVPLIVSERDNGEKLDNDLVVKSKGLNIVSIELLKNYFLKGEKPIVYKLRGNLLVNIDPVKFREIRLIHGYSLGELADKIGVSRKAIYEYERGQIAVSIDRAIRIAEVLGEDIFEPIDILTPGITENSAVESDIQSRSTVSRVVSEICSEIGSDNCSLYRLFKTPIDYVLKIGDKIYSIVFKTNDFIEKINNALKITSIFNSKELIVKETRDLLVLKNEIMD